MCSKNVHSFFPENPLQSGITRWISPSNPYILYLLPAVYPSYLSLHNLLFSCNADHFCHTFSLCFFPASRNFFRNLLSEYQALQAVHHHISAIMFFSIAVLIPFCCLFPLVYYFLFRNTRDCLLLYIIKSSGPSNPGFPCPLMKDDRQYRHDQISNCKR